MYIVSVKGLEQSEPDEYMFLETFLSTRGREEHSEMFSDKRFIIAPTKAEEVDLTVFDSNGEFGSVNYDSVEELLEELDNHWDEQGRYHIGEGSGDSMRISDTEEDV